MADYDIHVHHLTRVEGHGDVLLKVKDNRVEHVAFNVVEAPRFFEAMLKGRAHYEVREIVTRICGICAVGHALSSLRASEAAMSLEPSEQTVDMRKLALHGENLSSHYLHYYFLAAPDFLGVGSVLPLAASHPDVVKRALKLKKMGNDLCECFVGRHVHPISLKINGFSALPNPVRMKQVQDMLVDTIKDLEATIDLFATLKIPDYNRETEYVSLGPINGSKEYPFYDGNIITSNGKSLPPLKYTEITNEVCHPDSTAKYCAHNGKPYQVGALARFNNNYDLLRPEAKKAAEKLGIKPVCHNPYMITVAQIVETVHITYDAIDLISKLLGNGLKDEPVDYKVKAGTGAGAVEVPRGILFHGYTYDNNGYVTKADCVIPTTQNVANINEDFKAFVPSMLGKPESEISLLLQMLVRAYDPCISCSAHLLDVRVERE
jgi:coenzyme F420-reducing hydrogenase alpha subunit